MKSSVHCRYAAVCMCLERGGLRGCQKLSQCKHMIHGDFKVQSLNKFFMSRWNWCDIWYDQLLFLQVEVPQSTATHTNLRALLWKKINNNENCSSDSWKYFLTLVSRWPGEHILPLVPLSCRVSHCVREGWESVDQTDWQGTKYCPCCISRRTGDSQGFYFQQAMMQNDIPPHMRLTPHGYKYSWCHCSYGCVYVWGLKNNTWHTLPLPFPVDSYRPWTMWVSWRVRCLCRSRSCTGGSTPQPYLDV